MVTNSISSLLWISIVIPNFKSYNIIMSARVYFMKRVKDCKDVSIMSPQDEQWRRTSLLFLYTVILQWNLKQTKCKHSRRNSYRLRFLSRYHYFKSKKYLKKTISNSSLNFHVYWDTLYIALSQNFTQKIVTLTYLD